jgi:oligoribonuclease
MYVSIDIETLGLNSESCDTIEFGAVLDDLKSPIDSLPIFHCYLVKDNYRGEPYAMSMHAKKLEIIAARTLGYNYLEPLHLDAEFASWLKSHGVAEVEKPQGGATLKISVAGKNFATFDMAFLNKIPNWGTSISIKRRIIDPAVLYFDPKTMEELPDLESCLAIAGIQKQVTHNAVDDALDVVKCLRYKWNISNS